MPSAGGALTSSSSTASCSPSTVCSGWGTGTRMGTLNFKPTASACGIPRRTLSLLLLAALLVCSLVFGAGAALLHAG